MPKFFRIFTFFILYLLIFIHTGQAAISVGFGPEHFLWREYNLDGSQALEESGFRYALQLHWEQNRNHGFLFGYRGKLYLGTVTYNGQTLFPPIKPVNTNTSYLGFQNEGVLIFRHPLNDPVSLDLVTTLGWDRWNRNINPGNSNQLEDYDILFLKFGPLVSLQGEKGPWIGLGAKFPFLTFENAHINDLGFDQNPILHPGGQVSFYLNMGYRFNANWEAEFYYDSYRFSESPRENVTSSVVPPGSVYQPQSDMDLYGARAIYHFP